MKKLILAVAVAVVASGFSTYALTNPIQNEIAIVSTTEEFKEITLESLPTEVSEALTEAFSTATINKAYVNSKEQYKLEISIDGTDNVLYADKDGNWLESKDIESTKQ